ncbi:hypothetical protein [Lichenifustis flavocetrariae]|uniref:Uncharacterized protein n=1 Tax=Lichenifustis flavocetrariae TaxID=2949735 RepID=A0AA41YV84_9HYPH|nr:hypothetical protein [Lichenifustis flavocetrariae]MCW6509186.1 hypothetical protein [Lichenifustis flavocetrariae]
MNARIHVLAAEGVRAGLDLEIGQLAAFIVTDEGRQIAPFHRVPWAETAMPEVEMPPHLRRMSMDFFCAPFGPNDVDPAPYHGWPANSRWSVIDDQRLPDGHRATFRLDQTVLGATLTKTLTVRDGHPFLYQAHRFDGGTGALSLGQHAMVHFPSDGLVSFSEKKFAETSRTPLEGDPAQGRSVFRYPAQGPLNAFPCGDGTTVDLHNYPVAQKHDDLVALIENPANPLGWAAAVRPEQRDMALILKSPRTLPITLLWYSNGGRFYPPWSERHTGVLGIEEACSSFADGHRASIGTNALSAQGVQTCVELDGGIEIRTVIGALGSTAKPSRVRNVIQESDRLLIDTETAQKRVPFDHNFLEVPI